MIRISFVYLNLCNSFYMFVNLLFYSILCFD